ncbi:hypothetical protein [Nocardia fluminea]|uniref:hypothetical protein n=1 Tax=Nocardia fluminea TaxID=134984 RepID=UPI003D0A5662
MPTTRQLTDPEALRMSTSRLTAPIITAVLLLILAAMPALTNNTPVARADLESCTGTPADPIFPGYDSSAVLSSYVSATAGEIPIRRGFYCVPLSSQNNPALEAANGFGFGLDKVGNRHYIGRPQDGYTQADAIKATKFVLSAPSSNMNSKTDGWGFGWNFYVYAVGGDECPKGTTDPELCQNKINVTVRAATTDGGADHEPTGGMPAGDPLGLQTVYCDNGNVQLLRCDLWVTAALAKGATGQGIN